MDKDDTNKWPADSVPIIGWSLLDDRQLSMVRIPRQAHIRNEAATSAIVPAFPYREPNVISNQFELYVVLTAGCISSERRINQLFSEPQHHSSPALGALSATSSSATPKGSARHSFIRAR